MTTAESHDPADLAADTMHRYAAALLSRDAAAIADAYAVPALILFPGSSIVVTDRAQTEAFFESSMAQYDDVTEAEPRASVIAAAPHSVWVDVTWRYDGADRERFVYQLVADDDARWRIAVLTPLELDF